MPVVLIPINRRDRVLITGMTRGGAPRWMRVAACLALEQRRVVLPRERRTTHRDRQHQMFGEPHRLETERVGEHHHLRVERSVQTPERDPELHR